MFTNFNQTVLGRLSNRPRRTAPISIICLALAAYKAEKGQYPDTLDKLSPAYLRTVPLDPFTDKPMKYARTEKGYKLYSFGPEHERMTAASERSAMISR